MSTRVPHRIASFGSRTSCEGGEVGVRARMVILVIVGAALLAGCARQSPAARPRVGAPVPVVGQTKRDDAGPGAPPTVAPGVAPTAAPAPSSPQPPTPSPTRMPT